MNLIGGQGQELDIAALFYRLTLDTTTEYLLGESVNSLDDPRTKFASAFAEVQRGEYPLLGIAPTVDKSLDADPKCVPTRSYTPALCDEL